MNERSQRVRLDRLVFHPLLRFLSAAYAILWVYVAIAPKDRMIWFLENIAVALYFFLLWLSYKKYPLSKLSYSLIMFFMILHLVGSYYSYADVPLGYWLRDLLHTQRNPYDRIVHFSFGLLFAYPYFDFFKTYTKIRMWVVYYLPIDVIFALSAMYEIAEAVVAWTIGPTVGGGFLGSQGDIWDPQSDMICAGLGAIITMTIVYLNRKVTHSVVRYKEKRRIKINH